MDGLLLIDKPVGPTSHDVVARVRRALGKKRAGHTGTLDPAASGLLPVVLGRATRLARFIASEAKRYETVITLGVETDTYDAEGVAVAPGAAIRVAAMPARAEIERALDRFRGTFEQRPPAFSAKKIAGQRSYDLARAAGAAAAARPAAAVVTAYAIDVLAAAGDTVALAVACSAGFYIRSLAHDLGAALGVGAHVRELRRTRIGGLDVADALPLEMIEVDAERARAAVVPLRSMLPWMAAARLTEEGARRAKHGRALGPEHIAGRSGPAGPYLRLLHPDGELLGIASPEDAGVLHPSVILM